MTKPSHIFIMLSLAVFAGTVASAADTSNQTSLTNKQIMNDIITPTTSTIWGASDLQTDTQWQNVRTAALRLIQAGETMKKGGAGEGEKAMATEVDWQTYNDQMINAAQQVIEAVKARDEDALFSVGNDALYPPCEACHQKYQKR